MIIKTLCLDQCFGLIANCAGFCLLEFFLFAPGDSPDDVDAPTKWCRPPLPNMRADKDKLVFQQIDVDHYIGKITRTVFCLHRK